MPTGSKVRTHLASSVRTWLGLDVPAFATLLGFAVGTVRRWEQERAVPAGLSMTMLGLVERAIQVRGVGAVVRALRACSDDDARLRALVGLGDADARVAFPLVHVTAFLDLYRAHGARQAGVAVEDVTEAEVLACAPRSIRDALAAAFAAVRQAPEPLRLVDAPVAPEWPAFVARWGEVHGERVVTASALVEIADDLVVLAEDTLPGDAPRARATKFGMALQARDQVTFGIWTLRRQGRGYRLVADLSPGVAP